jgi:TRAP-type C4-dicarboxylate transport system permease small subunit
MRLLRHCVDTVPAALAAGLAGAITVLLVVAVIGRYSGLYALVWIEEAARAMFIWLCFLGAAVGVRRRGHFRLELIESFLPRAGRRTAQIAAHASLGALGMGLVLTGVTMVSDSAGQYTNALNLPLALVYSAIPVSGVLFVVFAAELVWETAREAQR